MSALREAFRASLRSLGVVPPQNAQVEQPRDPLAEASRKLDEHRAQNLAKLNEPHRKAAREGWANRKLRAELHLPEDKRLSGVGR